MKNAILLSAAVLVLVGMAVWYFSRPDPPCPPSDPNCPPPTATPAPTATPTPASIINISIASGINKKEWMEWAVAAFNSASTSDPNLQVNKRPIFVKVLLEEKPTEPGNFDHYRSPTQVYDTLKGKIKPTILSPAEETWLLVLKKEWRALYPNSKEIFSDRPTNLVQTPVIIAMWQSRAEALGCWPIAGPDCTWGRIRALAISPDGWGMLRHPEWGRFKFGYAYVGESDVGTWTAILLCMAGAKKSSDLALADVGTDKGCGQAMADVEKAVVHRGVSSPVILGQMQTGGPEYLDAVTTYEKEVIAFNLRNKQNLREPLVAAYPRDGTAIARHPFAILDGAPWVTAEQVEAARVFQRFLLSAEQQNALPTVGRGMRPAAENAKLGPPIDASNGANPDAELVVVSLSDLLVLERIIEVWHTVKKHANIVLVFDKSGSMQGPKLTEAVKGAKAFVEAMDRQDTLLWMPFDDRVYDGTQGLKGEIGEQLIRNISSTAAGGETALYDTVCQAYRALEERRKSLGDSVRYGIVVLSDGKDTSSKQCSLALVEALLRPSEGRPTWVQIHTIGIGTDADDAVLSKIAASANGRYWKVKDAPVVVNVYREIAKYW